MIALKNCTAVQFDPPKVAGGVDIIIDGTTIHDVGPDVARKYDPNGPNDHNDHNGPDGSVDYSIDCTGKIVWPGLVCSHTHFYSGLARGITAELGVITDFVTTLQHLWWKMDKALDHEILYHCALVSAMESIKAGTTAVIDHHASQSFVKGSLEVVKSGFEKAGLRGSTCFEVSDRQGMDTLRLGVEENVEFAEKTAERMTRGPENALVTAMIGGHAPFTLPDEGLTLLSEAARKTGKGIHLHVAEDRFDQSYSHARYGKDILVRLNDFGLLNDKSIIVHGLFLSDEDRALLNKQDAYLVHNVRSNMNNGVGYIDTLPNIKNVALGTDGIGSDMYEEFKFAFFKHTDAHGNLGPDDFLRFLNNGNTVLERNFPGKFGRLEPNYTADLVVSDYRSPTPLLPQNIAGHMAFGMKSSDVETVIINGKIVYENGEFPYDASEIYKQARKAASDLWKRMDSMS